MSSSETLVSTTETLPYATASTITLGSDEECDVVVDDDDDDDDGDDVTRELYTHHFIPDRSPAPFSTDFEPPEDAIENESTDVNEIDLLATESPVEWCARESERETDRQTGRQADQNDHIIG